MTMTIRPVEEVFRGPKVHWVGNGFRVRQYFPLGRPPRFFDRFSPFILLDYNEPHTFPGTDKMVGIGPHPHRGFETVTIAFEGSVAHGDSRGNFDVIHPGDVQWMTAGEGILHKEYHEKEYAKNDRVFHMIQLWVNLPAKDKMTTPAYQALTKENMGKVVLPDEVGTVTVIAGEVLGAKGPAHTFSPIHLYRVQLQPNASATLEEPSAFNTGLLVIGGSAEINEAHCERGDFALLQNEPGSIVLRAGADGADVMVFSGEPLNEPVAAGGPFVMNSREELDQAYQDYYAGAFGTLE